MMLNNTPAPIVSGGVNGLNLVACETSDGSGDAWLLLPDNVTEDMLRDGSVEVVQCMIVGRSKDGAMFTLPYQWNFQNNKFTIYGYSDDDKYLWSNIYQSPGFQANPLGRPYVFYTDVLYLRR